jgi:hypothetical protein
MKKKLRSESQAEMGGPVLPAVVVSSAVAAAAKGDAAKVENQGKPIAHFRPEFSAEFKVIQSVSK